MFWLIFVGVLVEEFDLLCGSQIIGYSLMVNGEIDTSLLCGVLCKVGNWTVTFDGRFLGYQIGMLWAGVSME